jgi:hypothetical protein
MIATKNTDTTIQSTLQGERVAMAIHQDALAHIMSVMTDLYSDPELACIREYSTNARDSHIEAGNTAPIEITLPSDISPFLKIRDFGIGLDADGIRSIYSQYGASTKRETNDQVGMLGLGCKSALAYTNQFTLVGIRDGIKTVVSISRDEDLTGSMTIISTEPTDEASGVEVVIPVKSYNRIDQKAKTFFSFWDEGTVLVNGKAPERIDGLKVTDDVMICPELDQSYLVMGNVPYPIDPWKVDARLSVDSPVVAFVEIGSISFAPSRESLVYNAGTKEIIETVYQIVKDNVAAAVEQHISDSDTFADAFRARYEWSRIIGSRDITVRYQGVEIPTHLDAGDTFRFITTAANSHKLSSHNSVQSVQANALIHGTLFYNYDNAKFTASHKKKLLKYCEINNIDTDHFILSNPKPDMQWVEAEKLHDWNDVKIIKLEVNRTYGSTASDRPKGSYDVFVNGVRESGVEAADLPLEGLTFMSTTGEARDLPMFVSRALQVLGHKGTLVIMPNSRLDKFIRDFPLAVTAREVLFNLHAKKCEEISAKDWQSHFIQNDWEVRNSVKWLDLAKVNDPAIAEYLEMLDYTISSAHTTVYSIHYDVNRYASLRKPEAAEPLENPFDKYTMCKWGYRVPDADEQKHMYLYMNAVYADSLIEKLAA